MELDLPPRLKEQYRPLRELGRGGYADVWLAEQVALRRPVVVKVLLIGDQEGRERFLREARVLAGFNHPGIVRLLDFGQEEGCSYLVEEFEPGESLDSILTRGTRATWVVAARIALDISRALQAVHSAGVVHRDIKPSNVLVTAGGRAKLLDFGLAYLVGGERLTKDFAFVGTPAYAAPEQLRLQSVGPLTDLYSLGILLCEMITGTNPFEGSSLSETIHRHVNVPLDDLSPAVPRPPPQLVGLVLQLLAKDPSMRPGGAEEVSARLAALFSGGAEKPNAASLKDAGQPARPLPGDPALAPAPARSHVSGKDTSRSRAGPWRLLIAGWRVAFVTTMSLAVLLTARLFLEPGAISPQPSTGIAPATPGRTALESELELAVQPWSSPASVPHLDGLFREVRAVPRARRSEVLREGLRRHPLLQSLDRLRPYSSALPRMGERLSHRPELLARLAAGTSELSRLELFALWADLQVPEQVKAFDSLPGMPVTTMSLRPLAVVRVLGDEIGLWSRELRDSWPGRMSQWSGRIPLDLPATTRRLVLKAQIRRVWSWDSYVKTRIVGLDGRSRRVTELVNLFPLISSAQDRGTILVALLPGFVHTRLVEISMELAFLPVGSSVGRIGIGPVDLLADGGS